MSTWGADAEQLDAVATMFGHLADVLDHNRVRLNGQVHHAPWRGHEADRFRRDWDSIYVPHLISAAAFLHAARADLNRNAAEQRQASGAQGGAASGVGGKAGAVGVAAILASGWLANAGLRLGLARSIISDGVRTLGHVKWVYRFSNEVLHGGHGFGGKLGPLAIVSKVFSVGKDGLKTISDVSAGHYADALFDSSHVLLDALQFTPVGKFIDAFNFGYDTGVMLDHQFKIGDHASSFIIQNVHDPNIGHRYDGVSGFGNFVKDGLTAPARNALGFLHRPTTAGGSGW